MVLCSPDQCTGCLACRQMCPVNAIDCETDRLEFVFPTVNQEKCINCGKCRLSCPVISQNIPRLTPSKIYRYKGEDAIRIKSSSGAFFSIISKYCIDNGYYVAGVVFDDDYLGVHYELTNSIERIALMRKSKYLEAKLNNVYQDAVKVLEKGGKVLFVGLPCHIAGFLKVVDSKYFDNVITVDLLCFGNGSPYVYKKCVLDFAKGKGYSKIDKVDFRHKPFIGKTHVILDITLGNIVYTFLPKDFQYCYGYVRRLILRQSCYSCLYSSIHRVSDITIGDVPGDLDSLGENVILCNSEKGIVTLNNLLKTDHNNRFNEADPSIKESIINNFMLIKSKPTCYDNLYNSDNLDRFLDHYLCSFGNDSDNKPFLMKLKRAIKHCIPHKYF